MLSTVNLHPYTVEAEVPPAPMSETERVNESLAARRLRLLAARRGAAEQQRAAAADWGNALPTEVRRCKLDPNLKAHPASKFQPNEEKLAL